MSGEATAGRRWPAILYPAWLRRAGFLLAALVLSGLYGLVLAQLNALGFPAAGAVAVFIGATLSSIAGFAFSAICAPLLAPWEQDPVRLVQVLALSSIAIQSYAVWSLRRDIRLATLAPFLVGGIAALPLGVSLLLWLPHGGHAKVLGALVLAYGAWTLMRPPLAPLRATGPLADVAVGFAGGITGGLAAFPGAFLTIWCGMRGWPKEQQRAVFQPYILLMQFATLATITWLDTGAASSPALQAGALAYMPPALLGASCGVWLFRSLSDRQFGRAVNILLICAGLGLLFAKQ